MASRTSGPGGEEYRLPGDLVYSLWIPPPPENANEENNNPDQLSLASTVPATINIPIDTNAETLAIYMKCGYDQNSGKGIPLTCLATGVTKCVNLNSYKTVLADRYLNPSSWIRFGQKAGQIKKITATFDLQIRHSKVVIQNVNKSDIDPLPEFYAGQYVYLGGWIGCVKLVRRKLVLRYGKGYECCIYEKVYDDDVEDETLCPRPDFQAQHPGDTVYPSSRDILHAEWISRPGWASWLFLRWFNWGSDDLSCAKVISNSVDFLLVDWYIPPSDNANAVPPYSKVEGTEIGNLVKLDMQMLWYGVKGNYKIKDSDSLLSLEEWEGNLSEELGYPIVDRETYLRNRNSGAEVNEKPDLMIKSGYEPGDEVIGKIVARRSTAVVAWQDGEVSDISVNKLVPYYSPVDSKRPFVIGEIVMKNVFGTTMKLLYGIVQRRQTGLCLVKWFGTESDDLLPNCVKQWESTEAVENLYLCSQYKFPNGIIVFTKAENVPGIVVGNSLSGKISTKMGNSVKKFYAYELNKFDRVAYSFALGCEIRWAKLEEKYFLNHKHLGMSMANIFNIIPPDSALLAPPRTKYFDILQNASKDHHFFKQPVSSSHDATNFVEVWKNEVACLEENQSEGLWVKVFADRKDLMSVMMTGQPGSLFEGALYRFDIWLPPNYPVDAPEICFVPYHGFDRRTMRGHQLDLMEIDGTLRLDKLLMNRREGDNYTGLWMVLVNIQFELFGIGQFMEHNQGKFASIKKIAFSSYSGEIEEGIRHQQILRLIAVAIQRWFMDPPVSSIWLLDAWKYWKLEVPLFISRTKQLMQLCQMEQYEQGNAQAIAGKYHFLVTALTPADTILMAEIDACLRDLASAYCKLY